MNENGRSEGNQPKVMATVSHIADELREFLETRVAMLRAELREKTTAVSRSIPLAVVAMVSLSTAYLLLTLALVTLVAMAFPSSAFRWFFAFLIVGLTWGAAGSLLGFLAWRRVTEQGDLLPRKTMKVLKEDKQWLENEMRGAA